MPTPDRPPDPPPAAARPSIPLAAKNRGLRVDLPGVVARITEFWEGLRALYFDDDGDRIYPDAEEVHLLVEEEIADLPVDVLHELLRLLKLAAQTCYTGGDPTVVDQFFQLWCLDEQRPEQAEPAADLGDLPQLAEFADALTPAAPPDDLVCLGAEELARRLRSLQRAVVINADTGRPPTYLWSHVLTATGFTMPNAVQLCRDAGEDPDAVCGEPVLAHLTDFSLPPSLLESVLHLLDEDVLEGALVDLDEVEFNQVQSWARQELAERSTLDAQELVARLGDPERPHVLDDLNEEHRAFWADYVEHVTGDGDEPPASFAAVPQAPEVSDA